jgi:DNA polymerase III subunit beta
MKFSALREDLLTAIQNTQYSTSLKGMMPILSGVKIETQEGLLVFHATDLESYTITSCPANVMETGACVVNLKVFMDFLKDLGEERISAEMSGNEMVIEGQDCLFRLYTMPPEDFPSVPMVENAVLEDIECSTFIPTVHKVAKAASRDEKRPTLLGMLLEVGAEEITMVSTDSYRLAIKKMKEGYRTVEEGQYIIPSAALLNLGRIAGKAEKMNFYRDENKGQVRFSVGDCEYIIRLIEGKFPKYGQFIPEELEKKAEVNKEQMLGALKRAALISNTIKLDIEGNGITIVSESREVGEGKEKVAAAYNGEEMNIAFNSRFLEDGINCIDGESVILGLSEALKPGIIREKEDDGFLYIIMPIRL